VQNNGKITVDMGVPILAPQDIPFVAETFSNSYPLTVMDKVIEVSAVSMGNPHCVLLVDDIDTADVEKLGAKIESHSAFPNRVNVGFMQLISRDTINLRVYERGVGETLACGTGACAAVVAGCLRERLDSLVTVNLPGGDLHVEWQGKGQSVFMTGAAKTVFQGQINL
jgi:diaminopimelate epimerase